MKLYRFSDRVRDAVFADDQGSDVADAILSAGLAGDGPAVRGMDRDEIRRDLEEVVREQERRL
jgi:hypothetical protein